jgi:ATP-dependent DNA helicase PIF1
LQNIRKGIITDTDLKILLDRIISLDSNSDDESKMCILYPINRKVDFLNQYELEHLKGPIKEFKYQVKKDVSISDWDLENFMAQTGIPDNLQLAVGAHIILTWNIDTSNGLVNGSQGIIKGFNVNNYPIVKFINQKKPLTIVPFEYTNDIEEGGGKISVFQLPLKLAWALSIHKVQGHNLDCALMDLGSNIFECGQIYVALSRIKSLKGVFLSSFDPEKIRTNPLVVQFYNSIKKLI